MGLRFAGCSRMPYLIEWAGKCCVTTAREGNGDRLEGRSVEATRYIRGLPTKANFGAAFELIGDRSLLGPFPCVAERQRQLASEP